MKAAELWVQGNHLDDFRYCEIALHSGGPYLGLE